MLRAIVRERGITHIHAHTRVAQIVAFFLKKSLDVQYVSTCHGFYRKKILRRLLPAWGDRIIAISDPIREHLVNNFKVPKNKIILIHNGIDCERYAKKLNDYNTTELRKYFGVGSANFIIGSVSKIEKTKGYQDLIRAIPQIIERYPKTRFVFAGEGKYKKKLIRLARRLHVEHSVIFLGEIEEIHYFLEVIDLFVLPSVWAEGFGLAILEAMAFGKPVVASNVGSVYMLVQDGENGLLVPPGNAGAISEAILHLMQNPELLEQMRARSLQIAQNEFTIEKVVTDIIDLYADMDSHESR